MTKKAPLLQTDKATIEISKYGILHKTEDEELNELVEIAAAVCSMPMAVITLCDKDKQYFVAKKGLKMQSVPLEGSFCVHTLQGHNSILVVNDTLADDRFRQNDYVLNYPHIRFYLGISLITPSGIPIGTLCLMDVNTRELNAEQENAIRLISKRVIRNLERRKLLNSQNEQILFDQKRLRFLTDNVPGAIFQLDYHHDEDRYEFSFTSAGISKLHPALRPKQLMKDPYLFSDLVHRDDLPSFHKSIGAAIRDFSPWQKEFRMVGNNVNVWIRGIAVPRRFGNITEWYGVFENINYLKEYQLTLESIAFDISHGLRKPVSNLMGLIDLFEKDGLTQEDNDNFKNYIKKVSAELDKFTFQLNDTYSKKTRDFEKFFQNKCIKVDSSI
jgi:PAS domain-containing protein